MSVQAMAWVLERSESKGAARLVLLSIANHMNPDGEGWVHVDRVCKEAAVSPSTYHDAVKWLCDKGELERDHKAGGIPQMKPQYRPNAFRFPGMAEVPEPVPPEVPEIGPLDLPEIGTTYREPSVEPSPCKSPTGDVTDADAAFTAFYDAYPLKRGRPTARRAFTKALKRETADRLIEAAHRYATDPNLPEPEFIPRPSTWLNDDRWNDLPLPQRRNGKTRDQETDWMKL